MTHISLASLTKQFQHSSASNTVAALPSEAIRPLFIPTKIYNGKNYNVFLSPTDMHALKSALPLLQYNDPDFIAMCRHISSPTVKKMLMLTPTCLAVLHAALSWLEEKHGNLGLTNVINTLHNAK